MGFRPQKYNQQALIQKILDKEVNQVETYMKFKSPMCPASSKDGQMNRDVVRSQSQLYHLQISFDRDREYSHY